MKRFTVISDANRKNFEERVNILLNDGWVLAGSLSTTFHKVGSITTYHQTLIRDSS